MPEGEQLTPSRVVYDVPVLRRENEHHAVVPALGEPAALHGPLEVGQRADAKHRAALQELGAEVRSSVVAGLGPAALPERVHHGVVRERGVSELGVPDEAAELDLIQEGHGEGVGFA